ncbi:hypothetical protein LGM89_26830 [Burkholderia sp. AU31624]|uniref:hypothetical protein n=1 Tax=Burkholderia sp. AU31624 TaxID=2879629 RepID=UPI001CF1833A|nr:hypothetical protein [Burkholderia sp. AU31624]MCA8256896.1 hypothetical protein [Burkholderia sp. AU31624]
MNKLNAARPGANDCTTDIFWKKVPERDGVGWVAEVRAATSPENIALKWHASEPVIDRTERVRSDERRDG